MDIFEKSSQERRDESGNALIIVLITIVLIGLLTALVTRSGSQVEQTGSVENNRILASKIMRFASGLESAINNMKLQGIGESQISFENSLTTTDYTNANCTSNSCLVFNVEGGGISYQSPPSSAGSATEWAFVGTNDVSGIGSTNADLIIMLPNINESLCTQINKELDFTYANDTGIDTSAFNGTYTETETLDDANGKSTGCLANNGTPFFYHVLIAR